MSELASATLNGQNAMLDVGGVRLVTRQSGMTKRLGAYYGTRQTIKRVSVW
jgi:hypothetical protein